MFDSNFNRYERKNEILTTESEEHQTEKKDDNNTEINPFKKNNTTNIDRIKVYIDLN